MDNEQAMSADTRSVIWKQGKLFHYGPGFSFLRVRLMDISTKTINGTETYIFNFQEESLMNLCGLIPFLSI